MQGVSRLRQVMKYSTALAIALLMSGAILGHREGMSTEIQVLLLLAACIIWGHGFFWVLADVSWVEVTNEED